MKSLISDATLRQLYSTLLQCRMLEEATRPLRRKKWPSGRDSAAPVTDAAAVGTVIGLRREDWIASSERDFLPGFIRERSLPGVIAAFSPEGPGAGEARGENGNGTSSAHRIPPTAGGGVPISLVLGVALASKIRAKGNIVVVFDGNDALSRSGWEEALAFAVDHVLPMILVVHDASLSRSQPDRRRSQGGVSLAGLAHARGMPVIPVESDDLVAIYRVASESIHKARHGGGPTVIEAKEFSVGRSGASSKAGNGTPADSVAKMESYLEKKGLFSVRWKQKVMQRFHLQLAQAMQEQEPGPVAARANSR